MLHRGSDQAACRLRVSPVKRRISGVEQLITFSLPLGDSTARPFDVGTRPCMTAVDEQHARPHVDREFVLFRKVMIEPREQELFDARVAVAFWHVCRCRQTV